MATQHPIEIEIDEQVLADFLARSGALNSGPASDAPEQPVNRADDQATRLRRLMQTAEAPAKSQTLAPAPEFVPSSDPFSAPAPRWTDRNHVLAAARNARIVAVASGKGGVGKSNIAVNLAIALASRGLRVTLLDADLGTANADVLCGIRPSARLEHVLGPRGLAYSDIAARSICDIRIPAPGGFSLVPGSAGISRMADLSASERRWLVGAIVELAAEADIILIDAAAGVGSSVTALVHAADASIVVTTPEPTAMTDAYALIKCLVAEDLESGERDSVRDRLSIVVNNVRDANEAFATHARLSAVCDRFLGGPVAMLGHVAQDLRVSEAVRAQIPLLVRTPSTPAAINIQQLATGLVHALGLNPTQRAAARPARGLRGLVRRLLGTPPAKL